ncbi:hypothetical protein CW306_26985 [Bacillus sp. BA3]|nr:hypothetical protein CW306_26985 [Bacillus sp. BA3]CAH0294745.1 hypothetical protein SRABI134_04438 [Peribacillus sp. Bi134]
MELLMLFIAIYLTPILCIVFIVASVGLAKKIKRDKEDTAIHTFWVTISFTLIVYSLVWSGFISL